MSALQPINITAATATLTKDHAGGVITVNRAAGSTLTLPASSGTGRIFRIYVGTTITSNSLIVQVANSTDVMAGVCMFAADAGDTVVAFETAASSDTITMNGSTTGGIAGTMIELMDVSSGVYWVRIVGAATGTEATPFSAAV